MRRNFDSWISNLADWEGFRSNDPDDPGKRTVYGISEFYWPGMFSGGKEPAWEEAKAFYLQEVWIKNGCDDLPFPMDVCHADGCVNPGPGAAKMLLYHSSEHADPTKRLIEYQCHRLRYYLARVRQSPVKLKYLAGWMDRCLDLMERTSLTMWSLDSTK